MTTRWGTCLIGAGIVLLLGGGAAGRQPGRSVAFASGENVELPTGTAEDE